LAIIVSTKIQEPRHPSACHLRPPKSRAINPVNPTLEDDSQRS
jgi:hypothetical protein